MKCSDYIAKFLEANGVKYAFGMSGGAIIHFVDSLYHNTSINVISGTQEQFSAFEADGYARSQQLKLPGVCFATSGPGATNLITGIATAFYDSIPLLVFTGQVARHRQKMNLTVRQFGFQELPSAEVINPLVKATYQPNTFEEVVSSLREAWSVALSGRPGPVHIVLADDLQRDISKVEDYMFNPFPSVISYDSDTQKINYGHITESQRLVFLVGNGARTCKTLLRYFLDSHRYPCVSTWAAIDLLSGLENYIGTIGTYSPKHNNVFQQADLIVALGCRLSNNIIGSIASEFSPRSKKIIVDIDSGELDKLERLQLANYLTFRGTCSEFIQSLSLYIAAKPKSPIGITMLTDFSILQNFPLNKAISELEKLMRNILARFELSGIFLDTGNNLVWCCNILSEIKSKLPEIHSSWNNTPMGYSVPASIGFCLGRQRSPTMAVIGDGGLGICLSELCVIAKLQLPIIILLVENGGHNIQKQTIETWLNSAYALVDEDSNLYIPDYSNLGSFVGIKSIMIDGLQPFSDDLIFWDQDSPLLIHLKVDHLARSFPVVPYGRRLTDPISL